MSDTPIFLDSISVRPERLRMLRAEVVEELAESMAQRGQLQAIAIRPRENGGYWLIAGWHRLEAAKKLEWENIRCTIFEGLSGDAAELAEIDENLIRADLSPAERALHTARRKALYEKLHPETKQGGDRKSAKAKSKSQNENLKSFVKDAAKKTAKASSTIARDVTRANKVVVLAEISGTSLDQGDELDALARLSADEQQKLAKRAKAGEKVSAKTRAKQVRRQARERQLAEKTAAAAAALGEEPPASVILVDPALLFEVRSEHGKDRSAENHFPCGTIEEMIALKPPMAKDAVVFMWTWAPHLKNSMMMLEAWGVEYKSYVGWDKEIDGTGYWARSRLELMLIATKGDIPAPALGEQILQLFRSRRREHSQKPDESYQAIERLYPNLVKLELFARSLRPGWRSWGNEIANDPG